LFVAGPPDRRQVFFDGEVYELEVAPEGSTPVRSTTGADALSAPMPATVARVLVAPGQAVRRGEIVVTLEAMKMEMPIRAPRDGSIKAVHCSAGQLVLPGAPLVEMA
jgi:biotin carboxyl carrier protein